MKWFDVESKAEESFLLLFKSISASTIFVVCGSANFDGVLLNAAHEIVTWTFSRTSLFSILLNIFISIDGCVLFNCDSMLWMRAVWFRIACRFIFSDSLQVCLNGPMTFLNRHTSHTLNLSEYTGNGSKARAASLFASLLSTLVHSPLSVKVSGCFVFSLLWPTICW